MTEPRPHRPSLADTVVKVSAVATAATAVVFTALFTDALHKRSVAAATTSVPSGQTAGPYDQPVLAPAPVTTRTS